MTSLAANRLLKRQCPFRPYWFFFEKKPKHFKSTVLSAQEELEAHIWTACRYLYVFWIFSTKKILTKGGNFFSPPGVNFFRWKTFFLVRIWKFPLVKFSIIAFSKNIFHLSHKKFFFWSKKKSRENFRITISM